MRRMLLVSLVICGLVGFVLPSVTDAQATPQRDPEALALLSQALWQMGGASITLFADIREDGTISLPGDPSTTTGTFVAKAKGTDFSFETTGAVNTSFRVHKGAGGVRHGDKLIRLHPYNAAGLSLDTIPSLGSWTRFGDSSSSVIMVGQVNLDNRLCYQVHVINQVPSQATLSTFNFSSDVFIDARTGLIAAIRYLYNAGRMLGQTVVIETRFGGYNNYGGALFPTVITHVVAGNPTFVFHVTSVTFNNGFTDADFVVND